MNKGQLAVIKKTMKIHLAILDFNHEILNLTNEKQTPKKAIHLLSIQVVNELEESTPNIDMIRRMLIMLEKLAESNNKINDRKNN